MADWYFELNETTDIVDIYEGDPEGVDAVTFAAASSNRWIDNEEPAMYYPDLCVSGGETAPIAVINGQSQMAQIIGGKHPVKRPR